MNKKRIIFIILIIGLLLSFVLFTRNDRFQVLSIATNTPIVSRNISNASWVSNAKTVDELILEADLVVRARVSNNPITRVVRHELSVLDENNVIVGTTISETLFSDTVFEVIKIYRGIPRKTISVMQTGGFDPTVSNAIEEVMDDPFYKIGEEYILFLVDISGDSVQAPNSELYRIVNPFGRYKIDNETVATFGEYTSDASFDTISNITDLETQIQQAIEKISE